MVLFTATGVAHSGEVGSHKEWGEKKENKSLRCYAPVSRILTVHVQFGKWVILMMSKLWFYKDYLSPLPQEYVFTADITVFTSHPQNSLK